MMLKEAQDLVNSKVLSTHKECISIYKKLLKKIPFKVGDYVMQKMVFPEPVPGYNLRRNPFKILSIKIEIGDFYTDVNIFPVPQLVIRANKCHMNKNPSKASYELNLDAIEPFVAVKDVKVEKLPKPTFVYLIESGDLYKIGFSNNPEKRLRGIQTSNPHKCSMLFQIKDPIGTLEKDLHKKFHKFRLGGEWFRKEELIYNEFTLMASEEHSITNNTLTLFAV